MIYMIFASIILAITIMMICEVVWRNEKDMEMDEKRKSENQIDRAEACVYTLVHILDAVGAVKCSVDSVRIKKSGHIIKVDSSKTPCRCTIYDRQNKKVYSGSMVMCAVIIQSLVNKK